MSKLVEKTYAKTKEILKFPNHSVQLAITVSDSGVSANAEGRKIVQAGTILGGGVLSSESVNAIKKNDASAEGVLLYDVDVTNGPNSGALIIHGFIKTDALPEAPDPLAVTALNQITFIK